MKSIFLIVFIFFSVFAIGQDLSKSNKNLSFTDFADRYINQEPTKWQKKGEFEKTQDWQIRVNEESIKEKEEELSIKAVDAYSKYLNISVSSCNLLATYRLGNYNADNEICTIVSNDFGNIPVSVPFEEAESFKDNFCDNKNPKNAAYFILNDRLALATITFTGNENKRYVYENPLAKNRKVTDNERKWRANDFAELAEQNLRDKDFKIAIDNYEKAISLNPNVNIDWGMLAKAYYNEKSYEKVISSYSSYEKGSKSDENGYNHSIFDTYILAKSHFELRNFNDAIYYFLKSEKSHSYEVNSMFHNSIIYRDLGDCYIALDQNDKGKNYYEKAIFILNQIVNGQLGNNSYPIQSYQILGDLYKLIGEEKKSKQAYKKFERQ